MSRACMVVIVLLTFLFGSDFSSRPEPTGDAFLAFAASGDTSGANDSNAALGYGFGAQINQPFHEVGTQAFASVFFFNLSRQDAFGAWVPVGGEGCSFFVNILDEKGRVVRRPGMLCPLREGANMSAPIGPFPLRAGTFRRFDVPLPLVYANSETVDPDGAVLPGGLYTLQVTQEFNGPGPEDLLFMFGGGDPEARVPFRIYQCRASAAGGLPIRELAKGSFSGYRNNDPSFFGEDLVLRTEWAGVRFWEQHTSIWAAPWNPPAVDFSREMVLVSLAGRRPDGRNSIQITSVQEKPCHLEVTVLETTTSFGIAAITSPFHMVAVPRSLKEVRFIHAVDLVPNEPITQCEGGATGSCP